MQIMYYRLHKIGKNLEKNNNNVVTSNNSDNKNKI